MAKADPLAVQPVFDGFSEVTGGVNMGLSPALLRVDQLAKGVNVTVRGGFPQPRPLWRKCRLDFGGDIVLQRLFETGRYQGHEYYYPDAGPESLIVAIGGYLFQIVVVNQTFKVRNITPSGQTQSTVLFVVPALGGTVNITVFSTANIQVGMPILINNHNYTVTAVSPPNQITAENVDDTPGNSVAIGAILLFYDANPATQIQTWMWQGEKWLYANDGQSETIIFDGTSSTRSAGIAATPSQISAGRMGAYWKGHNWWVNPDGLTFRAGDTVYSSSGSVATKKRDAINFQTQNTFLATGGDFSVPGAAGFITAMRFVNILDASLGQGPLQVATRRLIFGNDAPADNTLWQNATSVLLAVSQYANGAVSQWATQLVDGDMYYRSIDGLRSLIIGRRDLTSPGNVPLSREVAFYLNKDDPTLLNFCSAIYFDNRWVMTTTPVYTEHGCYHRGLVAINFDVISNIGGKKPPAWEGLYTGPNTLALLKGNFGDVERAFAFSFNTGQNIIELFELLPSETDLINDNNGQDIPVQWAFETFSLFRKPITERKLLRMMNGEISYDDLRGQVTFRILWKPDKHPCWIPWTTFSVCAALHSCNTDDLNGCVELKNFKPQYGPTLTLGEPPMDCDPIQNKPYREFFTVDIRVEVQGHCRVLGMNVQCDPVQKPMFTAPVGCDIPEAIPVVNLFRNSEQSFTANCTVGTGTPVTVTIPEGSVTSTISQADADAQALVLATDTATEALRCS